jgi:hypothetical protein
MTKNIFMNLQFCNDYELPPSYCLYIQELVILLTGKNKHICFSGQFSLDEYRKKVFKNKQTVRNFIKIMEYHGLLEFYKNKWLDDVYHTTIDPKLHEFFIKQ